MRNSAAVALRRDLGLHDHFVARQFRQQRAELHFRRAVAARGLDVIDAQFERAVDARLQIFLVGARDFRRRHVLPLVLVAHPAAGDDGHLQIGPAKTTIFHGAESSLCRHRWQAAELEIHGRRTGIPA